MNEHSPNTHSAPPGPPVVDVAVDSAPLVTPPVVLTVLSPPLVSVAASVPDVSVAVEFPELVAFAAFVTPPVPAAPPVPGPVSVVELTPFVVALELPPEPPTAFEPPELVESTVPPSSSLTCVVDVQANAVAATRIEHQTLPMRFRGLRAARIMMLLSLSSYEQ